MQTRRLDYIDAIRGIAAVAVISYHLRLIAIDGPLPVPLWMADVTDRALDGGVPLFFALSGFLLTMLMPSYQRHRHPTASFYAKRFFRIAPLFYVAIILWACWASALPPMDKLLSSVTFTFNLFPSLADSAIFAGWTIGVEMLFYLAFPVLYPRLLGITRKVVAVIASLVLAHFVDTVIVHNGIDPRYTLLTVFHSLPMFFLGMLVHDIAERLKGHPRRDDLGLLCLAGSALTFDLVLTQSIAILAERYWQGLACGLLLLAFALRPSTLANPVMTFLGRISYSMYLLHGLVILIMRRAFLAPYRWGMDPAFAYPVAVLMALLVIVPVSWVAFEVIEVPGSRLGLALVRWLDREPEGATWFGRKFVRGLR